MKHTARYFRISLGCMIFALGYVLFLKPAELAPGGVSGLTVLITHLLPGLNDGVVIFLINLPLLIAGTLVFGWKFLSDTAFATLLSSGLILFWEQLLSINSFVPRGSAAVLSGITTGIGIGLVFRESATTGGTDILVRLIQRRHPKLRAGQAFFLVDSGIVLLSGFVMHNGSAVFFSALSLVVSMVVMNRVIGNTVQKTTVTSQ